MPPEVLPFGWTLALRQTGGLLAKFVDPLRRLGLREVAVELLAGITAERLEIRALRGRHRLIASFPFVRVALQSGLARVVRAHDGEVRAKRGPSLAELFT